MRTRQSRITSAVGLAVLALPVFLCLLTAPHARAQQPSAQSSAIPQWQIDAGGKMAFDVASVKQNKSGATTSHSNVINSAPDGAFTPTGGLLTTTNLTLLNFIVFAYKTTGDQVQLLRPQLPNWATTDRFDIQAKVEGNPTKDQFRLMMQSLLADRFKLAFHYETRKLPAFALVLVKPGKTGPQLQPHSEEPKCPGQGIANPTPPLPSEASNKFPATCGRLTMMPPSAPGFARLGARNMSVAEIEDTVAGYGAYGGIDRPIIGQTALTGFFDFSLEWMPAQASGPSDSQPDTSGPTFLEALKDQLGLKLESTVRPIDVLVIDHVEEPSLN